MSDVITARAGTKLVVEALVSGKPAPVTKWKRGNDDLVTSDRLSIQKTPTTCLLLIKEVTRKDSGYYSLSAENSTAKVNQILRIIIMGKFINIYIYFLSLSLSNIYSNMYSNFFFYFRHPWSSTRSYTNS